MKTKNRPFPPLTPQEENIMRVIWSIGHGVTVRSVLELLPEPRPPYTTLASIVKNLQDKEYISSEKKGKAITYQICIDERRYSTQSIMRIVQDFFDGDYGHVVQFFARKSKITSEELQEILRQIEEGR